MQFVGSWRGVCKNSLLLSLLPSMLLLMLLDAVFAVADVVD